MYRLAKLVLDSRLGGSVADYLVGRIILPQRYAQYYAERMFWRHAGIHPEDVRHIVDVGSSEGWEIARFLKCYKHAECDVFEADPVEYQRLIRRFGRYKDRVHCHQKAVCEKTGPVVFHRTQQAGCGSLLPLVSSSAAKFGLSQDEPLNVEGVALDDFMEPRYPDAMIDLLWIDVQGGELRVLNGASKTLKRCRAVFLEVWTGPRAYQNGCTFSEVFTLLSDNNFIPVLLATGPDHEGEGDALFIKVKP